MRAPVLRLGALLLAVGGCGEEGRTPSHYTPANDKAATSVEDTTPPLARAVPGAVEPPAAPLPPPASAAVVLEPTDTASVRGSARLASAGHGTEVMVELARGKAGVTYVGEIRLGACGRLGATVASLNPVSADSLGGGAASTRVPVPVDSLLGGRHAVVFGKGGRPETCGEIASRRG